MVHLQINLDHFSGNEPLPFRKPSGIVKLVLSARDLDEPISLTMYNVVREGLRVAARILEKGGCVGIECQDGSESMPEYHPLRSVKDLEAWRDQVNRVVFLSHPMPIIRALGGVSALQGAGPRRLP